METQIPLLPSENLPNCMPAEKRALTFGGALCSVSAGGEKTNLHQRDALMTMLVARMHT
jgi:hypothetical protein